MSYQWSDKLAALMAAYQDDTPVDLGQLSANVMVLFPNRPNLARSLLELCTGLMPPGTICRHLNDCIAHDSVVRDILTVGHLAKLLSRMNVLMQTSDSRIVGLPNSLFDARSVSERAEFFFHGNILPIDAEVLQIEGVAGMLKREHEILSDRNPAEGQS